MKSNLSTFRQFAILGLALGAASQSALATLTMDLRITAINTGGGNVTQNGGATIFNGGVTSATNLAAGNTVTMTLFAYVAGTLAENPGDIDNGIDPTTFQGFQLAYGKVLFGTGGGTYGTTTPKTLNGLSGAFAMVGGTNGFGGNGAQPGRIQDLNGDGNVDFGSNLTSPGGSGTGSGQDYVLPLANSIQTSYATTTASITPKLSADSRTTQFNIGTFILTIGPVVNNNATLVSWNKAIFSNQSDFSAIWREDGISRNNLTGSYLAGPGVTIQSVPEPTAFGMVMLGALSMVGFRRFGMRRVS